MLNFHVINLITSINRLPTGIYGIGFNFILLKNRKVLVYVPPSDFFEVSGIIAVSRVQFLKTFYAELGIPKKSINLFNYFLYIRYLLVLCSRRGQRELDNT